MSYGVSVYATRALPLDEVQALYAANGFAVTAVDRTRLVYEADDMATIDGPLRVEPEDVPEEVLALRVPKYSYEFTFHAGAGFELVHILADALDAVAFDGEVLRTPLRTVAKARRPIKDEVVETLDLNWYGHGPGSVPPIDALWDSARRWFPESLPRRFGEWEPLQGKVEETGRAGFNQAWLEASQSSLIFTCAQLPCIEGELTTPIGTAAVHNGGWHLRLSLLAEPLTESGRRERLQQFFIGLAAASGADYASGEVIAGSIWSGRRLWSNAKTEKPFVSWTARGGFAGLAPRPVWWSWFGPRYLALLGNWLDRAAQRWHAERSSAGVFVSLADEPAGSRRTQSHLGGATAPGSWYATWLRARTSLTGSGRVHPALRLPEASR